MRELHPVIKKQHTIVRLVAAFMLIGAPLLYLVVAAVISSGWTESDGGEYDMLFYMLFLIAAVLPVMIPWFERVQLRQVQTREKSVTQVAALYLTTFILKAAFVESVYICGLVLFLVAQGGFDRLLAFYIVGGAWTVVHWPTEARLGLFLERVGTYD